MVSHEVTTASISPILSECSTPVVLLESELVSGEVALGALGAARNTIFEAAMYFSASLVNLSTRPSSKCSLRIPEPSQAGPLLQP